jgi:hypothetical protein
VRIAALEAALRELIDIKALKDSEGNDTRDYIDREVKAWETARQLLKKEHTQ